MNWDNGRTLGVIIGEDRFSVSPPEPQTLKLYMPLTAQLYEKNEWGDLEDQSVELDGRWLRHYAYEIRERLEAHRMPEEAERGIMHWYHEEDAVNQKVTSVVFDAEVRDGQLWGVAECKVKGELSPSELDTLKDYITGQASDGWGEGFEQREIETHEGELYVSLWNWNRNWSIQTEQERFSPKLEEAQSGFEMKM